MVPAQDMQRILMLCLPNFMIPCTILRQCSDTASNLVCNEPHLLIMQEASSMKAGSAVVAGHQVGHIAHLGGAFAGVLLVYSLSRLPAVSKR